MSPVRKSKETTPNERLRALVDRCGLTQLEVLALLNEGQVRPISASAFKSWLSAPESVRYRPLSEALFVHAAAALERHAKHVGQADAAG